MKRPRILAASVISTLVLLGCENAANDKPPPAETEPEGNTETLPVPQDRVEELEREQLEHD